MRDGILPFVVSLLILHVANAVAENHFLNEWAVEIPGGQDEVQRVAREHGYTIVKEVPFTSYHSAILQGVRI